MIRAVAFAAAYWPMGNELPPRDERILVVTYSTGIKKKEGTLAR